MKLTFNVAIKTTLVVWENKEAERMASAQLRW